MEKPFIHLLKSYYSFYFFDVNRNRIAEVDENTYELLTQVMKGGVDNYKELAPLKKLIDEGYLQSKQPERIRHVRTDDLAYLLQRKIEKLTLQVTQSCNLRCSYCVYSDSNNSKQRTHASQNMTPQLALKSVDFLMQHSIDCEEVNIGFYGGEPLLQFPLMQQVVNYVKQNYPEKRVTYAITTNATLMDDKIIDFFIENEVMVTVSLDGPEPIHDTNRRYAKNGNGSFQDVMKNLEILNQRNAENGNKLSISTNMVIDPRNNYDSINELFTGQAVMGKLMNRSTIVDDIYSDKKNYFPDDYISKSNYQSFLSLLDYFHLVEGLQIYPYAKENINNTFVEIKNHLPSLYLPEEAAPGGPCIPGQRRLFVTVNGDFYPCERVSETSEVMKIGSVEKGFDLEKCEALLNIGRLTEEKCKHCWAFSRCNLCARQCDDGTCLSGALKTTHCIDVRRNAEYSMRAEILMRELSHVKRGCAK